MSAMVHRLDTGSSSNMSSSNMSTEHKPINLNFRGNKSSA